MASSPRKSLFLPPISTSSLVNMRRCMICPNDIRRSSTQAPSSDLSGNFSVSSKLTVATGIASSLRTGCQLRNDDVFLRLDDDLVGLTSSVHDAVVGD